MWTDASSANSIVVDRSHPWTVAYPAGQRGIPFHPEPDTICKLTRCRIDRREPVDKLKASLQQLVDQVRKMFNKKT
jgi:hypothetical protein